MVTELECSMYCRAVGCGKPTAAVVDTLEHGWVELCASHAVLQLGLTHGNVFADAPSGKV